MRAQGISVTKKSSALLQVIALTSPGGRYDQLFLSNYAIINIIDSLKRVAGIGDVALFTPADYSMKVWLDTDKMTSFRLTPSDIANALKRQNIQAAVGRIGAQPALPDQRFQLNIQTKGRLTSVEEFGNVVVRANPDGSFVRLRDVARVELAARSSDSTGRPGRQSGDGDRRLPIAGRQRDPERRRDPQDPRAAQGVVPGRASTTRSPTTPRCSSRKA